MVDFVVRQALPTASPTITSPASLAVLTQSTNAFTWTPVTGAQSYEVVVTDLVAGKSRCRSPPSVRIKPRQS